MMDGRSIKRLQRVRRKERGRNCSCRRYRKCQLNHTPPSKSVVLVSCSIASYHLLKWMLPRFVLLHVWTSFVQDVPQIAISVHVFYWLSIYKMAITGTCKPVGKKVRRWMRSCMDEYYNSCYVQSVKGNRMNTKSVPKPFYLALYPSFLRPFATFVRFCFDWALHPTRTETRVNGLLEMIASRTTATYTRPDANYFLLVLCRWMCLCCHSQTVWLKQTDTHSTPIVTIQFILYR